MRLRRLFAIVCLSLFITTPAFAQSGPSKKAVEEAKTHYFRAEELFAKKDFSGALYEYNAAYQILQEPALLFNMAQCHRLLGHTKEAISAYEAFLKISPKTGYEAEINGYLKMLRKQIEEERKIQALPDLPELPPEIEQTQPTTTKTLPILPDASSSWRQRIVLPTALASSTLVFGSASLFLRYRAPQNGNQNRVPLLFSSLFADLSLAGLGVSLYLDAKTNDNFLFSVLPIFSPKGTFFSIQIQGKHP